MDPSSVITQVVPPPPQGSGSVPGGAQSPITQIPPPTSSLLPQQQDSSGGGTSSRNNNGNNENETAAAQLASFTGQKGSKKRSRRNFLCSIICCLGKKSSRHKDKDNGNASGSGGPGGLGDVVDGRGGGGTASPAGKGKQLLPELRPEHATRKCIVIDLDETLVHSSFKPISNADFIVPVEIDGTIHQVYVLKRPHVDEFLVRMGEIYECVLFTASLAKYADPVADLLDKWDVFHSRLFRESCVFHRGNYVKDLSRLGRELHKIIIVDNSPASYIFHPDNAVPVSSWFDDMNDRELLDLIPFLEALSKSDSVYAMLHSKFKTNNGTEHPAGSANKSA